MSNNLLDPEYMPIKELFEFRYNVPVYQRPYSWTKAEVNVFIKDMHDSFCEFSNLSNDNKQSFNYYMGNVILCSSGIKKYDIIDGQQRITTFSILLLSLYTIFNELESVGKNNRTLWRLQEALWYADSADKPIKDKRAIELGGNDKKLMRLTFDEALSNPKEILQFFDNFNYDSKCQTNIRNVFECFYNSLKEKYAFTESKKEDLETLMDFTNFILNNVYVMAIIDNDNETKAFSIFESINSKGKQLEVIDLIKTRIFSKLDTDDYELCLHKWGKLISETEDELYDYLLIFIRAYIKYYSNKMSFDNFKGLDDELCKYFNVNDIGKAYLALLNRLIAGIESYKALYDQDIAFNLIKDKKFKFYYSLYIKNKFVNPRPLFFRIFESFQNGSLDKKDAVDLIVGVVKFSVAFSSIMNSESRDAFALFSSLFDDIYRDNTINKDKVFLRIGQKFNTSAISSEDVVKKLKRTDVYSKNKPLGASILSAYESRIDESSKVDWDEAFVRLDNFGSSYTLDHILLQNPDDDDELIKYYKLGDTLKLKDNHDFPSGLVEDGMLYDLFLSLVLHRPGNLRLKGGIGNSVRGNNSDQDFYNYDALEKRNEKICTFFINSVVDFNDFNSSMQNNIDVNENKDGWYRLTADSFNASGGKPQKVKLYDKEYIVSTNKDAYKKVLTEICRIDTSKLKLLAKEGWQPYEKVMISNNKNGMYSPFELIVDEIYAETNISAKDVFKYLKELADVLEIPKEEISIYYKWQ